MVFHTPLPPRKTLRDSLLSSFLVCLSFLAAPCFHFSVVGNWISDDISFEALGPGCEIHGFRPGAPRI